MKNVNKFQLWIPNLFEFKGGIQNYLTFVIQALQSIYPKVNYELFVKHDYYKSPNIINCENTYFHFYGSWHPSLRTLAFAAHLFIFGFWQHPQLIIVNHLNFIPVAYWLKCLVGIPYWVTVYGIEAWDIKKPSIQKALHNADRIISISSYTRDRLLKEQNIAPEKISLLPCTFDETQFKIAPKPNYLLEQHNLKPEQPVILTVSRLAGIERYKGYDKILEALPKIRQAIPNVHYIIVGKGDDKPRIEQLIEQLKLQDCVTLAGFVPDEQLCDYYNLCDLFAMPSKREGFGIVYLEALACGKPTLGGNQDGAVDALCHGELGALVDPDDVEEIAQILIKILQGNYPNPIMYQPEFLRQKVIEIYGFDRFKQTLKKELETFFDCLN